MALWKLVKSFSIMMNKEKVTNEKNVIIKHSWVYKIVIFLLLSGCSVKNIASKSTYDRQTYRKWQAGL